MTRTHLILNEAAFIDGPVGGLQRAFAAPLPLLVLTDILSNDQLDSMHCNHDVQ